MLREIAGKPLILHTLGQALKARTVSRVIVATDDARIVEVVRQAGGEAVMTSTEHQSGSDRLAEVAASLPEGSVIVNVQGDEPMISPDTIDKAVEALINDAHADIATTCEPITHKHKELLNGNVVKVVVGDNGYALYFSRSPMPFPREASLRWNGDPGRAIDEEPELIANFRKHTGLYVYRREFLLEYTKLPPTQLERIEMLEQLRALENGAKIRVVDVSETSIGVDTEDDLERVRILLEEMPVTYQEGSEKDVQEIAEVYVDTVRRSFGCIYPDEYLDSLSIEKRVSASLERFSRKDYRLFTARTATGKLVGFADSGEPILNEVSQVCQLYSIYLLPEYHGLGIGKSLFKACATGIESLCLDTVESSPYRRFYDRIGGKIVGTGRHDFGGVELDTVIYAWDDLGAG
jgi:3-deoxy-manno-octulosonate cytidylyltransferase (CMP-KDO synthetase)